MLDRQLALRAATSVAARHGLRCTDPVLLHDGSNVLVHLAPAPVVARVGTLTALIRPDVTATLAKDLAVAGYLAGRGAPVVAPSCELPPGPHRWAGRSVTFWTFVEHERDHVFRPAEVGPLLADLHAVLRDYPGELPGVPPLDVPQVAAFLRSDGGDQLLTDDELTALTDDAARIGAALLADGGECVPLHGDAHPGNLLATAAGPVWTDFEDAWRGPIGWDLACLAETGRLDGSAAVAAYPDGSDERTLALCQEARRVQSIAWTMVFLRRFPGPERRADAVTRVAAWRDSRR